MKNGKPIVVASIKGLGSEKAMKQAIEVGNRLGYEVQNMNQSGMFWDCPNYTIIFRKVKGFQTQRAKQLREDRKRSWGKSGY
jgi:hypothetical protein